MHVNENARIGSESTNPKNLLFFCLIGKNRSLFNPKNLLVTYRKYLPILILHIASVRFVFQMLWYFDKPKEYYTKLNIPLLHSWYCIEMSTGLRY